jgi:glycosyltransferase involved in cell wall biosynthesis
MIYFLIPVFNESSNIEGLAQSLVNTLPERDKYFVIVNDASTDNTTDLVKKYFNGTKFTLLSNVQNSGPGFSFNEGFNYVLEKSNDQTDLIVTLEGDNTSDLSILPLMISLLKDWNFDLVLSSVYAQGGGFVKTSTFRKLISFVANQVLRSMFNISVLTLSSFYRTYKVSLIRSIKNNNVKIVSEKGFICAFELLLKSIEQGAKIIEVPMILQSHKRKGKSKMKIVKTSWAYLRFLIQYKFL